MLELKLFGRFELKGPLGSIDLSSVKHRALLSILALAHPRGETRERLTTLLWGSRFDEQARQNFRQALVRLKKAIGSENLIVSDSLVSLSPGSTATDVRRFETLVRTASEATLREAIGLADGELLSGIELLVIARHSSFQYKDKSLDAKRIGCDLGVQFIVEGSVRRVGEHIRITAQLVDALTGSHLWAQRYERTMQDIFAIQDEVTTAIVATVAGQVQMAEVNKARRKRTDSLAAYDLFLRGLELYNRYGSDDIAPARQFFDRAIQIDQDFAQAHALRSLVLVELSWIELWTSLDDSIAHLSDALLAGQTAVMLDGNDALCHRALAFAHMARKSFDLAAHHLGIATKLNPSDAETLAERATLEVFTGRPQEALNLIDLATKLNPMPSNRYWEIQGVALYQLRRYTEAASVFERATVRLPHTARYLAACYAQMGRLTEATALVAESLRKQPHFTLGVWATAEPYQSQADLDHMREGMRKAGLPE